MAIALINSSGKIAASGPSNGSNCTFNATGSNLVVSGGAQGNFGSGALAAITPSDSLTNTWTSLTKREGFTSWRSAAQLFYVLSPSVGSGQTFNVSSSDNTAIGAAGFSGVAAFGAESAGGTSAGTTTQPGSLTPSEDGCLLIAFLCYCRNTGDPTVTIDNSFTILYQGASNGQYVACFAYKVQTTAAAINPTWTHDNDFGSSVPSVSTMAYWTPAASATLPGPRNYRQAVKRASFY